MYFPLLLTLAVVGSVLLTVLCALLFYRGVYLLWLNLQLLVSTPNHAVKLEFVCKCVCVCDGHGAEAGKEGGTLGRMSRCEEPAVGREMFWCVVLGGERG